MDIEIHAAKLLIKIGACSLKEKSQFEYQKIFLEHVEIENNTITLENLKQMLSDKAMEPLNFYYQLAEFCWDDDFPLSDFIDLFYRNCSFYWAANLKKFAEEHAQVSFDKTVFDERVQMLAREYFLAGKILSWKAFLMVAEVLDDKLEALDELNLIDKESDFYGANSFKKFCEYLALPEEKFYQHPLPLYSNDSLSEITCLQSIVAFERLMTLSTSVELSTIVFDLISPSCHFDITLNLKTTAGDSVALSYSAELGQLAIFPSRFIAPAIISDLAHLERTLRNQFGPSYFVVFIEADSLESRRPELKKIVNRHYASRQFSLCYNGWRATSEQGLVALRAAIASKDFKWVQGALLYMTGSIATTYQLFNEDQKRMIKAHFPSWSGELEALSTNKPYEFLMLLTKFYDAHQNLQRAVIARDFFMNDNHMQGTEEYEQHQTEIISAIKIFIENEKKPLDDLHHKLVGFLFNQYNLNKHPMGQEFIRDLRLPVATISFCSKAFSRMIFRNFIEPFYDQNIEPLNNNPLSGGACYGIVSAFTAYALSLGLEKWASDFFELICYTDPRMHRFYDDGLISLQKRHHIEALCFFIWYNQNPGNFTCMPNLHLPNKGTQCFEESFETIKPLFWDESKTLRHSKKQGSFYSLEQFREVLASTIEKFNSLEKPFVVHFLGQARQHQPQMHATALYVNPLERTYYYFCSNSPGHYCYNIEEVIEKVQYSFNIPSWWKEPILMAFQIYTTSLSPDCEKMIANDSAKSRVFTLPTRMFFCDYKIAFESIDDFHQILEIIFKTGSQTPLSYIPGEKGVNILAMCLISRKYEAVRTCCACIETGISNTIMEEILQLTERNFSYCQKAFMQIFLLTVNPLEDWFSEVESIVKIFDDEELLALYRELPHKIQQENFVQLMAKMGRSIPVRTNKYLILGELEKEAGNAFSEQCCTRKGPLLLSESSETAGQQRSIKDSLPANKMKSPL